MKWVNYDFGIQSQTYAWDNQLPLDLLGSFISLFTYLFF